MNYMTKKGSFFLLLTDEEPPIGHKIGGIKGSDFNALPDDTNTILWGEGETATTKKDVLAYLADTPHKDDDPSMASRTKVHPDIYIVEVTFEAAPPDWVDILSNKRKSSAKKNK